MTRIHQCRRQTNDAKRKPIYNAQHQRPPLYGIWRSFRMRYRIDKSIYVIRATPSVLYTRVALVSDTYRSRGELRVGEL